MPSYRPILRLCLLLLVFGVTLGSAAEPTAFPLKVSPSRRYLVDQQDRPFLYHADTAWMLFNKLTVPEAIEYLTQRQAQGFNVVQVQLTGFLGMTNRQGQLPFAGTPPEQRFDQPNEAFFASVDQVVEAAGRMGLLLAIAPAWSGCCGEGWAGRDREGRPTPLNTNGPEASRRWGQWLGKRYGKHGHILWILGGDNDPNNAREEIRSLGLGLKDTAPKQLITYHAASTHSSTDVWPSGEPWLDVSMVYTYFRGFNKAWNRNQPDVYEVSLAEYAKTPIRPFFLGESTYEGEHDAWGSALQARKQAYWCLLSGGMGQAYGSPNWNLPENWRSILEHPGGISLGHLRRLFESRPWWTLIPDRDHQLTREGHGTFATNNYVTSARTEDRSSAFVYLPTARPVVLDLTQLTGPSIRAWWFNPRTGSAELSGELPREARRTLTPPGDGDWVLVLDDSSRAYPPPGTPRPSRP